MALIQHESLNLAYRSIYINNGKQVKKNIIRVLNPKYTETTRKSIELGIFVDIEILNHIRETDKQNSDVIHSYYME